MNCHRFGRVLRDRADDIDYESGRGKYVERRVVSDDESQQIFGVANGAEDTQIAREYRRKR